jgi:hypothetical protein
MAAITHRRMIAGPRDLTLRNHLLSFSSTVVASRIDSW